MDNFFDAAVGEAYAKSSLDGRRHSGLLPLFGFAPKLTELLTRQARTTEIIRKVGGIMFEYQTPKSHGFGYKAVGCLVVTLVLGLLIFAPRLFPRSLEFQVFQTPAVPMPVMTPQMPTAPAVAASPARTKSPVRSFDPVFRAPSVIPNMIAVIEDVVDAGIVSAPTVGVASGPFCPTCSALGSFGTELRTLAPSPAPLPPAAKKEPEAPRVIQQGGKVQAANILRQIKPLYPPLAKQAGISGVVRFSALIGSDGIIKNLQVVSGHPLLVPAALAAVKEWTYKPTLLNGVAVEVQTQIDVNFTLAR